MIKARFIKSGVLLVASLVLLAACASKSKGPEAGPLPDYLPLLTADLVWRAELGKVAYPLVPKVVGSRVVLASSSGNVMMLDSQDGTVLWQASAGNTLTAGVGSNGYATAVVTRDNDLVTFDEQGKEVWRKRIAAQVLTPPLVSGGRVFVNATDRSIQAYDARNGAGLWRQQQSITDSLTLRRDGVLDTYYNMLIVGLTANLYAINPDTGVPLWGFPIGTPRGTNEIERLADLVGGIARNGDLICARSYQNAISCVKAGSHVLWSKKSSSDVGIGVDERYVYAVEGDGKIVAFDQATGDEIWSNSEFLYHKLTAPLVLGQRSLVIGDSNGNVHLISRQDGAVIGRLFTDKSGIAATPIAVDNVLLLVTKGGTVYGFRPQ